MPADDPGQLPEPGTPEWSVALALRKGLRRHLGPKHGYLPSAIASEVVAALRLSRWHISKEPPSPPHSTPGPAPDKHLEHEREK